MSADHKITFLKLSDPSFTQLQVFYREYWKNYISAASSSFDKVLFAFNSQKLPGNPDAFILQLT